MAVQQGVDYSFARPSPAGLAAAGMHFAGRYVGPGSGKFLTDPERVALFAAGLDIFLLAEGNADSAAGGYNVGVNHAQLALSHARQLGAPDSVAIYFAVDYDVSSKGWETGPREYLRGACSVLGVGRVGVYGSYRVMGWAQRDAVASWFFQTYAWSAGAWYQGNHVEQWKNGVIVAGGEVDLCRSMVDEYGQWRASGIAPQPRKAVGDDMIRLIEKDGRQYIVQANPLSETGFSWVDVTDDIQPQVRVLTEAWGGGMANTADARTNKFADDSWKAGAFGRSTFEVREAFVEEVVAKVIAKLPAGPGGAGATPAQVRTIVRDELDATKLGGL